MLHVLDLPMLRQVHVLPFFDLTMVWNQGVTFGLFQQGGAWGPWLLAGIALVVVVLLIVWMHRAERRLIACALGAIAGGAVGNVLDRIRFGAVEDFFHLHAGGYSWYMFNVADSAVVCGVAVLILEGLLPGRIAPPAADRDACGQARIGVKPRPMRPIRILTHTVSLCGLLALAACNGDDLTRTFGLTRDAPDEFRVTTRAPLSMPPDLTTVPPPQPGTARPQELTQEQAAQAVLSPNSVLQQGTRRAVLGSRRSSRPRDPPRRATSARASTASRSSTVPSESFTDRLMFWRSAPPPGTVVDAKRESQRLRQDAALGQSPNSGDTPIIQRKRQGLFGSLF